MTNLARLVPHIITQTDESAKGWSARWRMVTVVAMRTQWADDLWTELGISDLQEYGRSLREAQYDRSVLLDLETRGILLHQARDGGRHRADLWRLRGDRVESLRKWRGVPWKVSREHAIGCLRAHVDVRTDAIEHLFPGQSAPIDRTPPPYRGVTDCESPGQSSVTPDRSDRIPERSARTQAPDQGTTHAIDTKDDASTQCLWGSKEPSLSLEREGERDHQIRAALRPVLNALQNTLGAPCIGRQEKRLQAIVAANLGHHDQLCDHITRTFRGMYSVRAALDLLEQWQPAQAPGPDPQAAARRAEMLRRLIATFADSDPDRAAELAAELAGLEGEGVA